MKIRDIKELIRAYELDDDSDVELFIEHEGYDIDVVYVSKEKKVLVFGLEAYTKV